MPSANTILTDSVIIATLLLEVSAARGESAADGLTRLLPNLDADQRGAILNDAQVLSEQQENAAMPNS